jgi:transposase-like protein
VNLIKFIDQFPDETACKLKFKAIRDQEGVVCRKCGGTDHYWLGTIWQYQCKHCKARTTLRSGTVMQSSNLPYKYWFIAIHLLTATKKTFSALELQRQLGHKFYEPIWYMMQKLRKTMGIRDSLYKIDKVVELDEGFFESVNTEKSEEDENEKRKRGRGSQKQTKVMVMASTIHPVSKPGKHKKPTKFRYVRMVVVEDLKTSTVNQVVGDAILAESIVVTDNYRSYNKLSDQVWVHEAQNVTGTQVNKVLPWVHTMISNAKRNFLGVHHMISKKYFQDYIDEFCYKVNRRYFGEKLFERLLIACVNCNYKNFINVS